MTDWRKRIENIVFRRTGKTLEGMVVGDAMEIVGEVCEWLDNQIGPGTLDDANGCAAPATGAVRPLAAEEPEAAPTKTLAEMYATANAYCPPCDLIGDHWMDCQELHVRASTEYANLVSGLLACECGAEAARCGGHSAWCPKA